MGESIAGSHAQTLYFIKKSLIEGCVVLFRGKEFAKNRSREPTRPPLVIARHLTGDSYLTI